MRRFATTALAMLLAATVLPTFDGAQAAEAKAHPVGKTSIRLDDGRQVVLWSPDGHKVLAKHSNGVGKPFGASRVVHRAAGRCTDIYLAANQGTVAVTLACFQGAAYEDQAPDDSRALVSTDLTHWQKFDAEELYTPPGVSPSGRRAVWDSSVGVIGWRAGHGFAVRPGADLDEVGMVVSNDGQVTVAVDPEYNGCRVELYTRAVKAKKFTRSYRGKSLAISDGCTYSAFRIDSHRVLRVKLERHPPQLLFVRDADKNWVPRKVHLS